MKKIMHVLRTVFYCILIGFLSCETDKPHINKPEPCSDVKYRLYVGNWGFDQVYVIDLDSNTVIDTLSGFSSVWSLSLTKSGKKLYICRRDGPINFPGSVFVLDLMTKEKKEINNRSSNVSVAPDGSIIIFSYIYHSEDSSVAAIGFIDSLTDVVSFFDTLNVTDDGTANRFLQFDPVNPIFYAFTNEGTLFSYNYKQKKIEKLYSLVSQTTTCVISANGKTLFSPNVVFDFGIDSIIGFVGGNPRGSIALTPAGDFLYVTDPGGYIIPPSPTGKVYIFETAGNSYVGEIDIRPFAPESKITDYIVVSPDGKTAYVSNWAKYIFVIDLETNTVKDVIVLGSFTNILAIAPVCNDSN